MKYVLFYDVAAGTRPDQLREHFPAHKAHWASFVEAGSLLAIGPMENPSDGALAVFTTRADAEGFAAADPFVTEGLVGGWRVLGWREALLP